MQPLHPFQIPPAPTVVVCGYQDVKAVVAADGQWVKPWWHEGTGALLPQRALTLTFRPLPFPHSPPLHPFRITPAPTVMVYDDQDVKAVLAADGKSVEPWWPEGTAALVGPSSLNVLQQPRQAQVKGAFTRAFGERAIAGHVPAVARAARAVLDAWIEAAASGGDGSGERGGAAGAPTWSDLAKSGKALPLCDVLASATFHTVLLGSSGGADQPRAGGEIGVPAVVSNAVVRSRLAAQLAGGFVPPMVDLPFTAFGQALHARRELLAVYSSELAAARKRGAAAKVGVLIPSGDDSGSGGSSSSGSGDGGSGNGQRVAVSTLQALAQMATGGGITDAELLDGVIACLFGNAGAGPTFAKLFQYLQPGSGSGSGRRRGEQQQLGSWWERLRAEQLQLVEEYGPRLDAGALERMPLAEAVVREALRITPVVPAIFRM